MRSSSLSFALMSAFLLAVKGYSLDSGQSVAYKTLTSDEPVVHITNGQGSEPVYLLKSDQAPLPTFTVTNVVGHSNSIQASDIHPQTPKIIAKNVFAVSITVKTQAYVEPGVAYEGELLLTGDDAQSTVAIKFRIEDDSAPSFDVTPATISAILAAGPFTPERVRVKNSGKTAIQTFLITSMNLIEPGGSQYQMSPFTVPLSLAPGTTGYLDFNLPTPDRAGVYTGTLDVVADSGPDKPIALTVESRGPYAATKIAKTPIAIPLLLFLLTVAGGFGISTALDSWYGQGGLLRAQAYLAVVRAEDTFKDVIEKIVQWRTGAGRQTDLEQTRQWIAGELAGAEQLKTNFSQRSLDNLTTESSGYAVAASVARSLWSVVNIAERAVPANRLAATIVALDTAVKPKTQAGLDAYAASLQEILTTGGAAQAQALAIQLPAPALVQVKITFMGWLYRSAIGGVVLITAYGAFYQGHPAFGKAGDYLAVLIWSFGLTATGTQILGKVHKP